MWTEVVVTLQTEKIIIMIGIFIATLCFGIVPFKLVSWASSLSLVQQERVQSDVISDNQTTTHRRHRERLASRDVASCRKNVISLAICFSGGVFLAACLLDLFPNVHGTIDRVICEIERQYHTHINYPCAEFIIVLGFFLVLILEQFVLYYQEGKTSSTEIARSTSDERSPLISSPERRRRSGGTLSCDDGEEDNFQDPYRQLAVTTTQTNRRIIENSSMRSFLLLVALSFHSIFEGLAIGLQKEVGSMVSIFVAVSVHKAVMAFSLGLNLAQSDGITLRKFLFGIFVFSISSPIGVGIGIALCDIPPSLGGDIANGILQGIACGTFLYITFFEVLPKEFNGGPRFRKLFCLILGYSIVCGILLLTH